MDVVINMHLLEWGTEGVAWRWLQRLFAWEEDLLEECVGLLTTVILQVNKEDRWVWLMHFSHCYNVSNVYNLLIAVGGDNQPDSSSPIQLKIVTILKIVVFAWRLLRNRLPTKTNSVRHDVLIINDRTCIWAWG